MNRSVTFNSYSSFLLDFTITMNKLQNFVNDILNDNMIYR